MINDEEFPTDANLGRAEGDIETLATLNELNRLRKSAESLAELPTLLGKEKYKQIIESTATKVMAALGHYIPAEDTKRVFPNLDLDNIADYNFGGSNIDIFILERNAYRNFRILAGMGEFEDQGNFITLVPDDSTVGIYLSASKPDEKSLIVVNEHPLPSEDMPGYSIKEKKLDTDLLSKLEQNLQATLSHELLHALKIGNDFPEAVREGIVELYAQYCTVVGEESTEPRGLGYEDYAVCLLSVMFVLMEEGIVVEDLNKAIISKDKDSMKKVGNVILNRYGLENVERFNALLPDAPVKALELLESWERLRGKTLFGT